MTSRLVSLVTLLAVIASATAGGRGGFGGRGGGGGGRFCACSTTWTACLQQNAAVPFVPPVPPSPTQVQTATTCITNCLVGSKCATSAAALVQLWLQKSTCALQTTATDQG